MNVIARAMAFVIVLVAVDVQQIELVNQAVTLEHVQRAVNRNAMDTRIDALGALEDGAGVQMLFGVIHHL